MTLRRASLAAAVLLPLALAGCAGWPGETAAPAPAQGDVMAQATLPRVSAGDTWTYSVDGEHAVEKVIEVEGDGRVLWAATDGRRWESLGDPLLPPARSLPEAGPRLTNTFTPSAFQDLTLFPLQPGNAVAYTTETTAESDGRTERTTEHRCEVRGPRQVTVPAGEFATAEIFCQRGGRFETLYYAPAVRNTVMELRDVEGRMERKELISYAPVAPGAAPEMENPAAVDQVPARPALPGEPAPQGAPVEAEPLTVPTPLSEDPEPATDAALPGAGGGPWTLQLGAMSSEAAAEQAWQQWQARVADVLAGAAARVTRVDGLWRLTVGDFPTRAAAGNACDRLKATGVECLPKQM